jgi:Glycosyltransferase family 17
VSIILRIIVSSSHELPFLRLNIHESNKEVDRILVCEADFTHTGEKRDYIFPELIEKLPIFEREKIEFVPLRLGSFIDWSKKDGDLFHHIENLIRNQFCIERRINPKDIVIAVDADEIIYRESYRWIIRKLTSNFRHSPQSIRLKLHQFFYKLDYLWYNNVFIAPVAANARFFLEKSTPAQWRYEGRISRKFAGCHFSWVMEIEDMLRKLDTYSHHDIYGKFSDMHLLEKSVREKKYPFDENIDFRIQSIDLDSTIFPKSMDKIFDRNHRWYSDDLRIRN